ncbi:restriction endonuclease subunit S [Bacillus pumilus]|uniref:restriction endonuclease subunit S n=1 Tax=Bacillus pumilus TaxID=1408 RepID=UPI0020425DD9|nr:restriction endonuclease subunit S [Bacillus pumilus]MCM3037673.1 restriction endonuclease subunit S [Bacillus pumilus]
MRPLFELEKTAINVDWNVLKIKRVLDTPITDGPHETPELLDEGIPFLSAESIKKGKIDFNLKRGYISREDHEKYIKKCKPQRDDIFMIKSGATTGNVAMVETDEEFSIWSPLALIRADKEIIQPKYLYYFIGSAVFREQVEISWSFGTQQNIGMKVIENLFISIPPLHLQEKLVHYIEKKVVQIDKLIEMKELNIKLLEQLRQSIITEAVTKGLIPNVKMKDSGIEWIGEIPEHWEIKKIKNIANVYSSNVDKKSVEGEKEVLLCNYVDVYYNDSITADINFMKATAKDEQIKTFTLKKHDVIITKDSESPKDIAIPTWVSQDLDGVVCGYHLSLIRCFENTLGHYLYYTLESNQIKEQFYTKANGVTRFGLSKEVIKNGLIAIPPFNEQLEIAEMLNNVNQEVRSTVEKLKMQIEKLKEYRQSLIYEAVTGKIDVRDMELDEVR